jgi:hypothetical protein
MTGLPAPEMDKLAMAAVPDNAGQCLQKSVEQNPFQGPVPANHGQAGVTDGRLSGCSYVETPYREHEQPSISIENRRNHFRFWNVVVDCRANGEANQRADGKNSDCTIGSFTSCTPIPPEFHTVGMPILAAFSAKTANSRVLLRGLPFSSHAERSGLKIDAQHKI